MITAMMILLKQAAKREVKKFASNMVTSDQARAEIDRMNQKEQMMQGEGHLLHSLKGQTDNQIFFLNYSKLPVRVPYLICL